MSSQRFLDCMAMQPRGGFSSKSHDCFEEKAGISFLFFPFITNDGLRPITNPIYTKKNGRAFAYPQARESKPYVHKQETPPAYRKEHFTVSCAHLNFRLFACTEIS